MRTIAVIFFEEILRNVVYYFLHFYIFMLSSVVYIII